MMLKETAPEVSEFCMKKPADTCQWLVILYRNGAYSSGQRFDLFATQGSSLKTCSRVRAQCRSEA